MYLTTNTSCEFAMLKQLEILIIEDDTNTQNELINYINTLSDITIVGVTNDSDEGIELVNTKLPHAIILDLELSNGKGNGISFLQILLKQNLINKPFILITTNNSSQLIYKKVHNLGADFLLCKHQKDYSAKMVVDFLLSLKEEITNIPINLDKEKREQSSILLKKIKSELLIIGINPKSKGFLYLCDAILLHMNNISYITHEIANKYQKSEPSVERAMQNAINKAWNTTDIDTLYKHYTAVIHSERCVPTLLEFVSYYSQLLK